MYLLYFIAHKTTSKIKHVVHVLKLIVGASAGYNVISAAVGRVYINMQPEYELPNSTRFG